MRPRPTIQPVLDAIQRIRERAERAASVFTAAGVPYAVVGGNAVGAHVGRIDPAAVRFTRDVDVLIKRSDLPAAIAAMEAAGFRFRHVRGVDCFLESPDGKFRDAVHLLYAGEKVKPDDPAPTPSLDETEEGEEYRVVSLDGLVRMKLVAYRRKDQTHLLDMLDVGLIDASWPARFSEPLRSRLQALVDDPDG